MSKTMDKCKEDMAWAIAHKAHAGQAYKRKKCDWEYITHIKRVVHNLGDAPINVRVVAILHDVVEDSDVHFREIAEIFGESVGLAICAISRGTEEVYYDYIERCRQNSIAKAVKSVDIADHILHCVRPDHTAGWLEMLQRYTKALQILHYIN